jgi:hypothetical protein
MPTTLLLAHTILKNLTASLNSTKTKLVKHFLVSSVFWIGSKEQMKNFNALTKIPI